MIYSSYSIECDTGIYQQEAQEPGAQLTGADRKKPGFEMSLAVPNTWICMAKHFCHSCIFNYNFFEEEQSK
jgi:hypothetical protein